MRSLEIKVQRNVAIKLRCSIFVVDMSNLSLSQSPGRFVVGNLRALKSSRFSYLASVSLGAG
jgi:hypothetical protein